MATLTKRRQGELLKALFSVLMDHPEGIQARHALAETERRITPTPHELGLYNSGSRRFEKIVRFSTIAPVKAGWMLKHKGRWTITDEGVAALAQFSDPEDLFRRASDMYRSWIRSQAEEPEALPVDEGDPEPESATVELEEAIESAWRDVEVFIQKMNPYDFQDLVGALLRALGYFIVWTAPKGKDGGVDLVAAPDPLGTRSPRIKVQVKRQQAPVNVDGLRSFMATLGPDDVGLFVSMGGFTKDAQDEARNQASRKVTLIDLERLFDLWVEHSPKLTDEDRRRLPLRAVWFLAPE